MVARNIKYRRYVVRFLVKVLELVEFVPKGTAKITEGLNIGGCTLVLGREKGIFIPMLLMVGKRPE